MEREMVKKQSGATTLVWGRMAGGVAFFKTTGTAADGAEFETRREDAGADRGPAPSSLYDTMAASLPEDHPEHRDAPVPSREAVSAAMAQVEANEAASEALDAAQPARNPVRKGITRTDGSFLDLTDRLEEIDAATKLDNMRIYGFVRDRIPRARVVGSYYLAGTDAESIRLCAALLHAMTRTRRWALVKWTKQKKQAVGVLAPGPRDTLLALELTFSAQVREPNPRCMSAGQVRLSPDEEDLAVQLVQEMRLPAAAINDLEDDRVMQRQALREAAEEGLLDAWEAPSLPVPERITDLEAALRSAVRVGA